MKVAEIVAAQQHPVFEHVSSMGQGLLQNYDCLMPRLFEAKRRLENEKNGVDDNCNDA